MSQTRIPSSVWPSSMKRRRICVRRFSPPDQAVQPDAARREKGERRFAAGQFAFQFFKGGGIRRRHFHRQILQQRIAVHRLPLPKRTAGRQPVRPAGLIQHVEFNLFRLGLTDVFEQINPQRNIMLAREIPRAAAGRFLFEPRKARFGSGGNFPVRPARKNLFARNAARSSSADFWFPASPGAQNVSAMLVLIESAGSVSNTLSSSGVKKFFGRGFHRRFLAFEIAVEPAHHGQLQFRRFVVRAGRDDQAEVGGRAVKA